MYVEATTTLFWQKEASDKSDISCTLSFYSEFKFFAFYISPWI